MKYTPPAYPRRQDAYPGRLRLENRIIDPGVEVGRNTGEVRIRERLGGLLNYYHRQAA